MAFKGDTEEQIQRHVHVMSLQEDGYVQLVGQRELVLPTGVAYGRQTWWVPWP